MLRQLIVGAAASACNIVIHASVMAAVVRVVHRATFLSTRRPWWHLSVVMIATVMVLMAAHICEILVWAGCYAIVEATPPGTDRVYFAFVNYTTLGYGDIIPMQQWLLLGPLTAMNGIMLFGWSTAVMFEVLRRTMRRQELVGGPI